MRALRTANVAEVVDSAPEIDGWLSWLGACWTMAGAMDPQEVYRWAGVVAAQDLVNGVEVRYLVRDAAEAQERQLTGDPFP